MAYRQRHVINIASGPQPPQPPQSPPPEHEHSRHPCLCACLFLCLDPKHEAGKLTQRITKGTLRATEAWTDGRYAEDDKYVELDSELAMARANVTEGPARRVIQTEPSHGFVAWQALVDGYAPKSPNDPAIALQTIFATPKTRKDAKELKERLTAWSLKVAEYEHQFKVIVEAQKIFVGREMMPKDIKRAFLSDKREPCEARDEQSIATEQHVPRRKTTPQNHADARGIGRFP